MNSKSLYLEDPNFVEVWRACNDPLNWDRKIWLDFTIQYGMLFQGNWLCIPMSSMREKFIKEKHSGGLVKKFGCDKTISIVGEQ
jgi:hypothetical protein